MTRFFAAAATVAVLLPLSACGGEPAQIVDYAPQRGSVDVSTATSIRITFDHDVDKASVESRLRLSPAAAGAVRWLDGRTLVYDHTTLRTNTTYEVILEAGYRDLAGNPYTLRHHWSFVTEGPPSLSGSSPSSGEGGIDPAAYLSLSFTRAMDATSLKSAITFSPQVPFDVRSDPSDSLRMIVAPSQLLDPNTTYQLSVSTDAVDVDGNQLRRFERVTFTTGPPRPLHGWITFATTVSNGSPGGLWIVDPSAFPRTLFDATAVSSFNWSPDGASLLIQGDREAWWDFRPGQGASPLPFRAMWAAPLGSGTGYVYLDDSGVLHHLTGDGIDTVIADNVAEASVAPSGSRVLFIHGPGDANRIWGYDVGLHARYVVASDSAPVFDATWSPASSRIAYLRRDSSGLALRVRNLTGNGATTTVAAGDLDAPAWLADSIHLVVAVGITTPQGPTHKAFVINTASAPAALNPAAGLPADVDVDVSSPVPSPDGRQIAFLSDGQVWLMNADGTRPIPLTKGDPSSFPYSCRAVAWTRT